MSNVNRVFLVGNLGCDVEAKYLPSGTMAASFRLATNERWTGKDGERQERTEWHRIVAYGRLAEVCAEYLSKGRRVRIEGSLRTRSWTDREGVKRYVTEINAKSVDFLDHARKEEINEFDSEMTSSNLNEEAIAEAVEKGLF
jgi:single-strand DNA-binding protein